MAIAASTIIGKAQILLQDPDATRWPLAELVGWFNDAQREVLLHRPEANAVTESFQLAQGVQQTLPASGVCLINVTRNLGYSANGSGRPIRAVSREVMDAQNPSWPFDPAFSAPTSGTLTAAHGARNFMYSPLVPKKFSIYPQAPNPATNAWYIEINYSKLPTDIALSGGAVAGNLGIDDIFANAIVDYVLFRAYSKDAEYAKNAQLAVAYYTSFANAVGITRAGVQITNPNQIEGGFSPNVPKHSA